MSIEDDPGPFKLATTPMVDAFMPVLVILPSTGVIDMVIVGLSPLDVYYRKGLRLDDHSMTYLSALPSFDAMRRQGYSFQYFSPTKDYVSDSFAILRGGSNDIVAKTLDDRLPQDHSYVAQFKLLAYFGEYQENRDAGNAVGGTGKGYRIDLGACDHNYEGENIAGLAPTPRTNGGVKCFMKSTGNQEIDSSQEKLRTYFGALMDAVQLIVDKVRQDHGYQRIYNDFTREKSFAGELREHVNAVYSRAEVSSNFVTLMNGNDGCCFHKDKKNCSTPSYDWTCCMAITVQSESTKRLYRAVTNLNSRGACGRAMNKEHEHKNFSIRLNAEMERITSSYREIYPHDTIDDVPTATKYTDLYLKDELPWVTEMDEEVTIIKYILTATAPTRDYFLSAAASAIYNLRLREVGLSCHSVVGLLLIAIYMSSFHQFYDVVVRITNDPALVERIKTDVAGTYYEVSELLFPGKFWGGKSPRFSSSSLDFKEKYIDNQFNFPMAVRELKELLKLVNTSLDEPGVMSKLKHMADSSSLHGLNVFRLQLFIPLAALCGLVLQNHLFHADFIEPAEGIQGGSFSALNEANFAEHRHHDTLLNLCTLVGLPRRLSLGEGLVCESHRGKKRYDLFLYGQDLFHLFLEKKEYSVKEKEEFSVKIKRFNTNVWMKISVVTQERLRQEDCG
jgi:hypothetical protein